MNDQLKIPSSVEVKREWARPEVHTIEAGSAESQRATVADGGGGGQAS